MGKRGVAFDYIVVAIILLVLIILLLIGVGRIFS